MNRTCNVHRAVSRRHRARRVLQLEHERCAVEAALLADGCSFRGRIQPRHRALAYQLDRIAHEEAQTWAA